MPLTLSGVLDQLNAVMPDDLLREQMDNLDGDWSSSERLAQFVANVAVSLHDPTSPDGANLERLAVNLESAAYYLTAASRRLRRLAEVR